jgi:hypothetical protein
VHHRGAVYGDAQGHGRQRLEPDGEVTALVNNHWHELGERLDAVALKLKMHREQSAAGEAPEAVGQLSLAFAETFDAAGNALRDEAVRADVREAGRIFVDAVATTFAALRAEVGQMVDRRS